MVVKILTRKMFGFNKQVQWNTVNAHRCSGTSSKPRMHNSDLANQDVLNIAKNHNKTGEIQYNLNNETGVHGNTIKNPVIPLAETLRTGGKHLINNNYTDINGVKRTSHKTVDTPLLMKLETTDTRNRDRNSDTPEVVSLDIKKVAGAGCDIWGTQRLELATIVRDYMQKFKNCRRNNEAPEKHATFILRDFCIENGTLLGAWRSGKFIPHDDDFDFALLIDLLPTRENEKDTKSEVKTKSDTPTNGILPLTAQERDITRELRARLVLEQIKAYLDSCLDEDGLSKRYATRIITTYCDKIEVFEPKYGDFPLVSEFYGQDARFYYVTVDIQPYIGIGGQVRESEQRDYDQVVYRAPYRAKTGPWHALKAEDIMPVTDIALEGELFPAPCNVETVLTHLYGFLGQGAVFNKETQKYEKRD